ncbi:DUF4012 domain-containing protein [bacterium]|nr:DUF4012 domain-containing protein [bacterium]
MASKKNILPQIFDIKPVKNGKIDYERIKKVKPVLNLKYYLFESKEKPKEIPKTESIPQFHQILLKEKGLLSEFKFFKKVFYFFSIIILVVFFLGGFFLKPKINFKINFSNFASIFYPKEINSLSESIKTNFKLKSNLTLNYLKNFEIEKAKKEIKENITLFENSFSFLEDLSFLEKYSQKFKDLFFLKKKLKEILLISLNSLDLISTSRDNLTSSLFGNPYASKKLFSNLNLLKENLDLFNKNFNSILLNSNSFNFSEFKKNYLSYNIKIQEAKDLFSFFEKILGKEKPKTYILLLQNNSEIRATGGFLGSFIALTLNYGRITNFKVYDIYDPDGQIKEKYIPPKPLWLTTPVWETRDANWFFDFPTSAKKIIFFLEKSGYFKKIDGIIAINTFVVKDLLKTIGPIEVKEYQKEINASNFLETLQYEVEYGKDKKEGRPKRILEIIAPKIYQKILDLDKKRTKNLINLIKENLEKKEIQLFFKDNFCQKIVEKYQFAGKIVKEPDFSDYLSIVFSNIAGGKTDLLIKRRAKLITEIEKNGFLDNTLIIYQKYPIPNKNYPFFRSINKSYLKVYLPKEAFLEEISGYKIRKIDPLANYSLPEYLIDADLEKIEESSQSLPYPGVDCFFENGKKVFGFWVYTEKGKSSKIILKYKILKKIKSEKNWQLIFQKQSGINLPIEIVLKNKEKKEIKFLKESPKKIETFNLKSFHLQ